MAHSLQSHKETVDWWAATSVAESPHVATQVGAKGSGTRTRSTLSAREVEGSRLWEDQRVVFVKILSIHLFEHDVDVQ